jgi:hypothetical protein
MLDRKTTPIRPPVKKTPHIKMQAVESSAIKSIGHHPQTNTLRVEFLTGGVYDYPEVTAEEHQLIMAAESKGRHIAKHIRARTFTKLPKAA